MILSRQLQRSEPFTKVPIDEALDVTFQLLQEDQTFEDRIGIPIGEICTLTQLCLKYTYTLETKFYEQIQGAATGSLLSLITANLHLEQIENRVYPYTTKNYGLGMLMMPSLSGHITLHYCNSLGHLKSIHSFVQFTMEVESNTFLDVMVKRTFFHHGVSNIHPHGSLLELSESSSSPSFFRCFT